MRKIIYYVATSIDGYISGPNDDISGFTQDGNGVTQYLQDLKDFDTVIMGRRTYEFGYNYGLKPGDLAYPHMDHYIFSKSMDKNLESKKFHICPYDEHIVHSLKKESGKDIYCCGGGIFASWLLKHQLIDTIKLKLNPFISGRGIKLFENLHHTQRLDLDSLRSYDHGLQFITYNVRKA